MAYRIMRQARSKARKAVHNRQINPTGNRHEINVQIIGQSDRLVGNRAPGNRLEGDVIKKTSSIGRSGKELVEKVWKWVGQSGDVYGHLVD